MGKFTLLTTLTLNAAGFDKGVDKAKKSTKALTDGVQTAGKTMGSAFAPLNGILGGVSGSMAGLTQVALGGIKSFKAMIPAINGIKTAIISTGIGAIVVALGTAFATLTSYLKGTEEGSMKLKTALGYLKGVFNALLVRVQLIGEAVSLLFERKFKEAGQRLKEAFSGGLLEEIKEDAKEAVGYAERENQLLLDKRALTEKEAALKLKVSELDLQIWNKGEGYLERSKALQQVKALELSLMKEKLRIANEEYNIIAGQNAMSKSGTKDIDKEIAAKNEILNVQREYNELMLSYSRKENEINAGLQKELMLTRQIGDIKLSVQTPTIPSLAPLLNTELRLVEETEERKLAIRKKYAEMMKGIMTEERAEQIKNAQTIMDSVSTIMGGLSGLLNAQKEEELKNAGDNTKKKEEIERKYARKQQRIAIGQALIGTANAIINASQTIPFIPAGLAAAATAAIMGGIQIATIKAQKFATGGIVGGSSFVGDRVPVLANSGEMFLNKGQQSSLFKMINTPNVSGGGEVTFRIDGTQLVGVLNNYNRRTNSYR